MPRKLNHAAVLFTNDPKLLRRPDVVFQTDLDLLYSNDSASSITNIQDFFDRVRKLDEHVLVMAEIAMKDGTMQEGGGVFSSWSSALDCVTGGKSIVTVSEDKFGNFYMTTVTPEGLESFFSFKTVTVEGVIYVKRRPYETRKSLVNGLRAIPKRLNCCRLSEKLHAASQNGTRIAQAA